MERDPFRGWRGCLLFLLVLLVWIVFLEVMPGVLPSDWPLWAKLLACSPGLLLFVAIVGNIVLEELKK